MSGTTQVRRANPSDAKGIAEVHVASWRSTYRGIIADAVLDGLSVDRRAKFWSQSLADRSSGVHTWVAERSDSGDIVGFASAGPEREDNQEFRSELYAIYLLDTSQGQGLGKHLTAAVVGELIADGFTSMLVWVLADNPARDFYRAIGGTETASKQIRMGEDDLEEIALGWSDLRALHRRLTAS